MTSLLLGSDTRLARVFHYFLEVKQSKTDEIFVFHSKLPVKQMQVSNCWQYSDEFHKFEGIYNGWCVRLVMTAHIVLSEPWLYTTCIYRFGLMVRGVTVGLHVQLNSAKPGKATTSPQVHNIHVCTVGLSAWMHYKSMDSRTSQYQAKGTSNAGGGGGKWCQLYYPDWEILLSWWRYQLAPIRKPLCNSNFCSNANRVDVNCTIPIGRYFYPDDNTNWLQSENPCVTATSAVNANRVDVNCTIPIGIYFYPDWNSILPMRIPIGSNQTN